MDAIPVCTVCKRYKDSAYEQERERKKITKKPKDRRPIGRPPIGGHKKTKQGSYILFLSKYITDPDSTSRFIWG